MNAAEIIQLSAGDGVMLSLSVAGTVKATGEQSAVNRWLPVIRGCRADVVELLRQEMQPTKAESEAELQRLVREVAAFHVFTPAEEADALRNAQADFDAALGCFRALRGEISK